MQTSLGWDSRGQEYPKGMHVRKD